MQVELFDIREIEKPRDCRACVFFRETPYWECHRFGYPVLRQSLELCDRFEYASPHPSQANQQEEENNYNIRERL